LCFFDFSSLGVQKVFDGRSERKLPSICYVYKDNKVINTFFSVILIMVAKKIKFIMLAFMLLLCSGIAEVGAVEIEKDQFNDIFDILNVEYSESGFTEQDEKDIIYSVEETGQGDIYGGIKIIGFKDLVYIDGIPFIPDNESIIVKAKAVKDPSFSWWGIGIIGVYKDVEKWIENGTAYATMDVTFRYYTLHYNSLTKTKRKHYKVQTAYFEDSCPAPEVLTRPTKKTGFINEYRNNIVPNTRVYVDPAGLTKIAYTYQGNASEHIFMMGERREDKNGVECTIYSTVDRWNGDIPNMDNSLIIYGPFAPEKLTVSCFTPYENFEITDFQHTIHETPLNSWAKPLIFFILRLILLLLCGYKLMMIMFT